VAPFLRRMGLYRLEPDAEATRARPTGAGRFRHVLYAPAGPSFRQPALLEARTIMLAVCHCAEVPGRRQDSVRGAARILPGPGQAAPPGPANAICGTDRARTSRVDRDGPVTKAAGVVWRPGLRPR